MKKTMKKLVALGLAVVLALGIVACGSGDKKDGDDSNTGKPGNSQTSGDAEGKSWEEVLAGMPKELRGTSITVYNWNPISEYPGATALIEQFEQETGIEVVWKAENFDTYLSKLGSMVASGESPDVMRLRSPQTSGLISTQPISVTGFDFSGAEWDQAVSDMYTIGGEVYGVRLKNTLLASPGMLLYNKSLIEKYDLDDPYVLWKRGQWTYDKFVQVMKDFKAEAGADFACSIRDYSELTSIFGVNGPITFDGKQYASQVGDSKFVDATQKVADLMNTDHLLSVWKPDEFEAGKCLFWSGTAVYARRQNAYLSKQKEAGSVNKILEYCKKSFLVILAFVLAAGACLWGYTESKAAQGNTTENSDGVRYVTYDIDDCTLGEAPTYNGVDDGYGYLFGGWYKKEAEKYVPLTDEKPASGEVYAKFVPAYVLGIRCQNFAGTTAETEQAAMRVVSSLDSQNYQRVGFELWKISKNPNGSYVQNEIAAGTIKETTTTYSKMKVYTEDKQNSKDYEPSEIFGPASNYLTAWKINKIPTANFGDIICIRPYWVTMDDAKVYGLTRYAHVEDGYLELINVPINLNNAEAVAAGLLSVDYDETKLELVSSDFYEYGQVFGEMECADKGGIVNCIGNVVDIKNNVNSDNLYINLRFKAKAGVDFSQLDFEVMNEDFVNNEETELSNYNVWKVRTTFLK